MTLASPYLKPGFYDDALARGKHRDIVGGRWEETALHQMQVILDEGLERHDHFLDIGCGCLRLGHRLVPWLDPGHYRGTDASRALMLRGYAEELTPDTRLRLPEENLVEDEEFRFPTLPPTITFALCWGVFTHLPAETLRPALHNLNHRFPHLRKLLLTVFLAPDRHEGPFRQRDGVVTHPNRPPWHRSPAGIGADAAAAGFTIRWREDLLPRGQALAVLEPIRR
ncbi:class I SAM-dependent methyltransferase [Pseudogemmobacter bohemicus]|uniref:class I SAM-dependent methyltransferase n=1 Tax=Pseudogemmobacter bohemicus TaxID=2250708 RepID=UPI000DD3F89C|nr:class I SAM-dependent methyltransferase [Pseudogemmobacter bohemicus]